MRYQAKSRKTIASVVAVVAVLGLSVGWVAPSLGVHGGAAMAQSSGGQGGGQGGGGHGGSGGQGGQGGAGKGQGGPGADSEGKGPQAGQGTSGSRGKPAWASEGIPEVELGRLNVARSPSHVLQRAYDEAIKSLSPEMIAFYNLSLDKVIDQLSLNWDNITIIDSPLQNLALLKEVLNDPTALSSLGITNNTTTLEAIFIGLASDKTVPVSVDTVTALTTILGTPVTGTAAEQLAEEAESVRIAALAGHDS